MMKLIHTCTPARPDLQRLHRSIFAELLQQLHYAMSGSGIHPEIDASHHVVVLEHERRAKRSLGQSGDEFTAHHAAKYVVHSLAVTSLAIEIALWIVAHAESKAFTAKYHDVVETRIVST